MRFLELHADNYGPLKDLHFELQSNVFVVLGHNEAGKSSFHGALESILYGFEVNTRDKHPLSRIRHEKDLELRAKLQLDDDTILNVRRILMSQGKLEILSDEGEVLDSSMQNAALPAMQSVPREVYQAVYSLTANDTNMQKDDVRGHIRELLLGETGLRGARPISTIREGVQNDMQALWRDSARGHPVAKELRDKLKQARKLQREGKKIDRELRDSKQELDRLVPDQETDRAELAQLRLQIDQLGCRRDWSAYVLKRTSIEEVDQRLEGCPAEWKTESLGKPAELEQKIEDLARQLVGPQHRLSLAPIVLSQQEAACLEKVVPIETVLDQVSDRKDLQRTLTHTGQGSAKGRRAEADGLRRLGMDSSGGDRLVGFPTHTLHADSDQWNAELEQFEADSQELDPSRLWILGAAIGALSVVLLSMSFGPPWAGLTGALLGFGFVIGAFLRPSRVNSDISKPSLPGSSSDLLDKLGMSIDDARNPQALARLAEQLEQVQQCQADVEGHERTTQSAQLELQELEGRWLELANSLDIPSGDLASLPNELRSALRSAELAQKAIAADASERREAQVQLNTLNPIGASAGQRLQFSRDLLGLAFPLIPDVNQAYDAWVELGNTRATAKAELERLQANPHFQVVQDRSGSEQTSPEVLQAKIDALETSTSEQSVRIGQLRERLASDKTAHLARAEETIHELEGQLQEALEARDELALLDNILMRAEASFRADNAPPVLKCAGEYLDAISQGRYTALSYPPGEDGNPNEDSLQVLSTKDGLVDVAKPLSRGTQEQIYLALRLGTLDYMDQGRETLPLVLDEALVHWDHARRASLYKVLSTVAKERQVILFTCHRSFAQEAESALNARLIELPSRYDFESTAEI